MHEPQPLRVDTAIPQRLQTGSLAHPGRQHEQVRINYHLLQYFTQKLVQVAAIPLRSAGITDRPHPPRDP
jgi:hypothetical protein